MERATQGARTPSCLRFAPTVPSAVKASALFFGNFLPGLVNEHEAPGVYDT